jgi:hypothetical protein
VRATHKLVVTLAVTTSLNLLVGPAFAESAIKLFRNGYQQIAEESFLSFDGCETGKHYPIGRFIFVCDSYDYSYEYGEAYVIAKKIIYGGKSSISVYLCTDDNECYSGQLYNQ